VAQSGYAEEDIGQSPQPRGPDFLSARGERIQIRDPLTSANWEAAAAKLGHRKQFPKWHSITMFFVGRCNIG
jgi:hypothetical protein